jgi:sulfate/thiosulfate transport system permease protein
LLAQQLLALPRHLPLGKYGLRLASVSYLALFVILPFFVVTVQGLREGLDAFFAGIFRPSALHAIGLTLWTGLLMAFINGVMGTLTAYVLVAYKFPGKPLLNALIDLPFAIPPLVAGVMIVLLYGPQTPVGQAFESVFGSRIVFATPGIVLGLLFISFPFVVRTVEPVLMALEHNQQEAAQTLGASSWLTFRRVILPQIAPAILTGVLLSFARALGEFGSVVVVSGNIELRTQTATVYVYGQVEGGNMAAASSVSAALLFLAFGLTFAADFALRRSLRWSNAHA